MTMQLGGYSLENLKAQYHHDLFEKYLPYLDRFVYDDEYGGFKCHIHRDGQHPTTHKRTWYDGRGVWVYAFLYHHLDPNPLYLERASQTLGLLMSMKSNEYPFWPWGYTQAGDPLPHHQADIYGSLFVAEGLARGKPPLAPAFATKPPDVLATLNAWLVSRPVKATA